MTARKIVIISLIAILMFIPGVFPSFQIGVIPITLQTMVMMITALLFGKQAVYGMLLYLGLGLIFPVYSGFASGAVALFQSPTSGFLLAFPVAALVIGKLYRQTFISAIISSFIGGIVITYIIGIAYAYLVIGLDLKGFALMMVPFIFIDIVKVVLASALASRLKGVV